MGKKIVDIEVVDAEKRRVPSKHYVYVIVVRWSDGSCFKIYRRYSRFFDLQTVLLDSFPIEGGTLDPSKRLIPFLPGKIFFGRSHIKDVAMKRLGEINNYCQNLNALPTRISQCDHVLDFFEVEPDDLDPPAPEQTERLRSIQLPSCLPLSKKGSSKEKKAEKISKPKRLECFVAVAEYVAQAPGELALQPGMKVEVLEKNDIGWWFVNSEDEQGWVPSTYLEPDEGTGTTEVPRASPGEEEMFVCIEDFHASGEDEVSLQKGVAVSVIQKNMDGWWLVSYQGKEAFAPGTYLKKANNASRMSMVEKSRLSGVEIVSSLQDVSTLLNAEKKEQSKADVLAPGRPNKQSFPSAFVKQCSLERGGSLIPPPRQNSVTKTKPPTTPQKSNIYMTLEDFTDTVGDGLSFKQGQKVLVLEKASSGWWLVRMDQDEGWVPASYLESYSGRLDTDSVYEMANEQENNGSDSSDGEWYTEPDEESYGSNVTVEAPPAGKPSKRPLPEIPGDNGDYEPVMGVQKGATRPMPPPPPPPSKGDNNKPSHGIGGSDSIVVPPLGHNLRKAALPKTDKMEEKEKKFNASAGATDLASVLKAKFESRAGTETNTTSNEDRTVKASKPAVPILPTKPSELKKQKEADKTSLPPLPSKPDDNKKKLFEKPLPPSKSKSPNIFQGLEKKPENPPPLNKGGLPKVPIKPFGSGDGSNQNKNVGKVEHNDVKSMAANLSKTLNSKSSSAPTAKVPVPPKPQIPTKPKPSVPSKPGVAAKPKPAIQPKVNQNVSNIASTLNNKLNLNKITENTENNNSRKNDSDEQKFHISNSTQNASTASSKVTERPKNFVVLYDFVGEGEGELSLNEGDTVELLDENGDWVFTQLWDEQGWVPAAYLQEI